MRSHLCIGIERVGNVAVRRINACGRHYAEERVDIESFDYLQDALCRCIAHIGVFHGEWLPDAKLRLGWRTFDLLV